MRKLLHGSLIAAVVAVLAMNANAIKIYAQTLGTGMAQTMTALTLSNTTNQLVLGTTNTVTISSTAPGASRTITLPDPGAASQLITYSSAPASLQAPPLVVYSTGSYTNATTTFSNVTGLSFAVAASTNYHGICRITWQGSAGTTGPKYQFTGPAAPTAVAVGMNSVVTATTVIEAAAVAFSSAVANTGTITTATNFTDTVDVGVVNGTNAGTVQLQAAANGAGTLTIQNGSYCTVQ